MLNKLAAVPFGILVLLSVGLTLALVSGAVQFLWNEEPWVLPPLLAAGLLSALRLWGRGTSRGAQALPSIHPGIDFAAIPVAGGIGFLVAVEYVVMFWIGVPSFRPLVVTVVVLGLVLAGLLIGLRKRDRSGSSARTY